VKALFEDNLKMTHFRAREIFLLSRSFRRWRNLICSESTVITFELIELSNLSFPSLSLFLSFFLSFFLSLSLTLFLSLSLSLYLFISLSLSLKLHSSLSFLFPASSEKQH
jgi:hypothetical protein